MKTLKWILVAAIMCVGVFGFLQRPQRDNGLLAEERLDQLTKAELYRRARAAGIEGRSRMNKAELVEALVAIPTADRREVRLLSAAVS